MTRLGGVKHNTGGAAAGHGTVSLKDLPEQQQRAYEIVAALKDVNELEVLRQLLERADAGHGVKDPLNARSLHNIAALYDGLGMALTAAGVTRFKQERGLIGGIITGPIAKAYVRALAGEEILVSVSKAEDATLSPSERACLGFLRELAKKNGAAVLAPVKQQLALGNPPLDDAAAALHNQYVGLQTVKEIAKATTLRRVSLSKEGLLSLAAMLVREGRREGGPEGKRSK